MAAHRVAASRSRTDEVLALDSARQHQASGSGAAGQAALDHRTRLSGAETRTRLGALRRTRLARLFTPTLPSVSRPMVSWWPNGAVFPPRLAPVKCTYPLPKHRRTSALGARPVRAERHNPWSIATLHQMIARVLIRQLPSCLFCGAPIL